MPNQEDERNKQIAERPARGTATQRCCFRHERGGFLWLMARSNEERDA